MVQEGRHRRKSPSGSCNCHAGFQISMPLLTAPTWSTAAAAASGLGLGSIAAADDDTYEVLRLMLL